VLPGPEPERRIAATCGAPAQAVYVVSSQHIQAASVQAACKPLVQRRLNCLGRLGFPEFETTESPVSLLLQHGVLCSNRKAAIISSALSTRSRKLAHHV